MSDRRSTNTAGDRLRRRIPKENRLRNAYRIASNIPDIEYD